MRIIDSKGNIAEITMYEGDNPQDLSADILAPDFLPKYDKQNDAYRIKLYNTIYNVYEWLEDWKKGETEADYAH